MSVPSQGIVQKYELNRKWFYLYGEASFHLCNSLSVQQPWCAECTQLLWMHVSARHTSDSPAQVQFARRKTEV